MTINVSKTKIMQIQKHQMDRALNIRMWNEKLKQITDFRYLVIIVSNDGEDEKKILTRITMARGEANNLYRIS